MKNIKGLFIILLSFLFSTGLWAQEAYSLSGKVVSTLNEPIEGAILSLQNASRTTSLADGTFAFKTQNTQPLTLTIWYPGYFSQEVQVNGREEVTIILIPDNEYKYNEELVLPFGAKNANEAAYLTGTNVAKKDFVLGRTTIDQQLSGQVAGLQVIPNGGMPGEGSFFNLRGIRSLVGDNAPLIVVNGIPFMADKNESILINGYSRNIFQMFNLQDIQNITVLKGGEASLYGSMGSNGVILIETDGAASNDLDTRVSYYGQFGTTWNNKRIPLLEGDEYKTYLTDIGLTKYSNMSSFYNNFPFLQDPNNARYAHLYNNNTDWQDLIYRNGFTTDNLFRVEGGDNIAKYDLSLGYALNNGIIEETQMQRYHAQLSTDILVSSKVSIFAVIGFAYSTGALQEQGMSKATNPILASFARSPLLSPYNKDRDGNVLATYSSFYYGESTDGDAMVSNPLAIVKTLDARTRQYDLNLKAGIAYSPIRDLTFNGTVGFYYNYNNQSLFIPGTTNQAIIPIKDVFGEAKNMVKAGVAQSLNMYLDLNGRYTKTFDYIHKTNFLFGAQMKTTSTGFDAGEGRNTANDFYQTLGNTNAVGRQFYGYLNKWNWMNIYAHADYTYNNMVQAAINVSFDGASSTGVDANRFYLYPSLSLAWLGKGWSPFQDISWINKLNIRAEYGMTGNSRYAATLGSDYYASIPYESISTIAWTKVSNTKLKPETNTSLNLGIDMNLFSDRLRLSAGYFNNQIKDMISALPLSSVYGSAPYYDNIGDMENKGVELSAYLSLIRTRDFEWVVGGNIAKNSSKVKSLGGIDQIVHEISSDGAQLVTKVGEAPYQYYGYETNGVYSTQKEVPNKLVNDKGYAYSAGDIRFIDQNGDDRIDKGDRVALGSSSPDFYGGFSSQIRYRGFALSGEFVYSKGNKAYNAVRRELESMSTLGNQSKSVSNRWILEGQVTNVPRALFGDPQGNSNFSDRWIEDASFLRMRELTLSYGFDKTLFGFFRSGTVYVTGENLLTFTRYLGLDPEFAYSYKQDMQGVDYAKVMQPKAVKLGINLKF
ncbi:SusC/RagA family TonB-linked outer membrane protein [Bacteroidales bacterium OttesenSCG-928-L03]|nr:SusC/RagA family TonB-linked outer membrane protein [Bacteroidales bacterium OttesenSCG-928-L03]